MMLRYIYEEKIKGKIIRVVERDGETLYFYFNQDGVYSCIDVKYSELLQVAESEYNLKGQYFNSYVIGNEQIWYRPLRKWKGYGFSIMDYEYITERYGIRCPNNSLLNKTIARLKEGDTLEVFDKYLAEFESEGLQLYTGLDRFVTRIEKPVFERDPENKKKNVFDFIRVTVCIVQDWEEDKVVYFKKHKDEIFKMVVEKLEANKKFQRFGIPVNFLKVSATIRRDCTVEFIFEMKVK